MEKELIFLGSITRAIRARDILAKNNIAAKIERDTGDITSQGCGYGIIVVDSDISAAKDILIEHGFISAKE